MKHNKIFIFSLINILLFIIISTVGEEIIYEIKNENSIVKEKSNIQDIAPDDVEQKVEFVTEIEQDKEDIEIEPDNNEGNENEIEPDNNESNENEIEPDNNESNENEIEQDSNEDNENEIEQDSNEGNENKVELDSNEDNENGEETIKSTVYELEIVLDETVIVVKSSDVDEYIQNNEKIVFGCFEELGNKYYNEFKKASNNMVKESTTENENNFLNSNELKFLYINDSWCQRTIKRLSGITIEKNGIVVLNNSKYSNMPIDENTYSEHEIIKFVNEQDIPLISNFDGNDVEKYKEWNIPMLVYFTSSDQQDKNMVIQYLTEIAQNYKNNFYIFITNSENFTISTASEKREDNLLVYGPQFQTIYSIQEVLEEGDKIDATSIEFFLKFYFLGKVKPQIVLAEFENDWDYERNVIDADRRIYYQSILNPQRDAIVAFYKIDCPFSQELLQSFEKLGEKYASFRNKISIVKFEAEINKIPKYSIWRKLEAYPTVVLFKANPFKGAKDTFYVYSDLAGRSVISLSHWIQKHAFYKPDIFLNDDDYSEQEALEQDIDYNSDDEDEENEEKINSYLEDPNLIYTRYGFGKENLYVSNDNDDDDDDEPEEIIIEDKPYTKDIPLTATYFELTSTTYVVKTSTYTPTPVVEEENED